MQLTGHCLAVFKSVVILNKSVWHVAREKKTVLFGGWVGVGEGEFLNAACKDSRNDYIVSGGALNCTHSLSEITIRFIFFGGTPAGESVFWCYSFFPQSLTMPDFGLPDLHCQSLKHCQGHKVEVAR